MDSGKTHTLQWLIHLVDNISDDDHNIFPRAVATRRSFPVWLRSFPAF
jgi:hypothetical protein